MFYVLAMFYDTDRNINWAWPKLREFVLGLFSLGQRRHLQFVIHTGTQILEQKPSILAVARLLHSHYFDFNFVGILFRPLYLL